MFFLYLLLWLLFFRQLSPEVMVGGIIISVIVYRFACAHMRYKPALDYKLMRKLFHCIRYMLVLVWETAKANIIVFRIVFRRTIKVEPRIIYFHTGLKTNAARAVLANSITLTPGTITVALEDDLFCVHCLDGKLAERIEDSVFVRQLRKIEE